MLRMIIKRDGREVAFDRVKIADAIYKAAQVLGGNDYEMAQDLAQKVEDYVEATIQGHTPTVEEVQDAVEHTLIENGHARTAKEYILYRAERTRVREMNTRLMKTYEDLTFKDAADNDVKRENANIDGDTAMGTMLKYGSEGAKQFYEMYVLNPRACQGAPGRAISTSTIWTFYTLTTTCCQIDLVKLLPGRFFHRPRLPAGAQRHPELLRRWPASPSSPTRTISTAARASRTLITAWPSGVAKTYYRAVHARIWPRQPRSAGRASRDLEESFKAIAESRCRKRCHAPAG